MDPEYVAPLRKRRTTTGADEEHKESHPWGPPAPSWRSAPATRASQEHADSDGDAFFLSVGCDTDASGCDTHDMGRATHGVACDKDAEAVMHRLFVDTNAVPCDKDAEAVAHMLQAVTHML
jgi:hypothetical protein